MSALSTVGARGDLSFLNDTWTRTSAPAAYPVYKSNEHGMDLLYKKGEWRIYQDFLLLARAATEAMHPNTIFDGEWSLRTHFDAWVKDDGFAVRVSNYDDTPNHSLADIGFDIFNRFALNKPIRWYHPRNPAEVYHSGAKNSGRRYCNRCRGIISGNNFVAQHEPVCQKRFDSATLHTKPNCRKHSKLVRTIDKRAVTRPRARVTQTSATVRDAH